MIKTKTIAVSLTVLMLGACGTMEAKKMKMEAKGAAGVSATECFAAGGTIKSNQGAAMCTMKDGSGKPII